jgi:hypothetical protein
MLPLVKYKGDHLGRTVMAVKCSSGEIIPLICDSVDEEMEYQKLCQLDIHDIRGQNSPLARPSSQPLGAIFGIAEPPLGWPWFVVLGQPFPAADLQRGYWSFDIADSRDDAVRQLKELFKIANVKPEQIAYVKPEPKISSERNNDTAAMFNNQLTRGSKHFVLPPLPPELRAAEGLIPWRLALDPNVGSEMVLLLLDRTPFVEDLAKIRPFDLRLKTGLVRTSHGPLCFLLFYVPNPMRPGAVYFSIDVHVNPLDPLHLITWRDLARQSHWHLILVGANDKIVDLFEFQNTFDVGQTLDQFKSLSSSTPEGDFDQAKVEFSATYTVEHLLQMEPITSTPFPTDDGLSISELQQRFASEIEALSEEEAADAYVGLLSIVHQKSRLESGLSLPVAIDETEVFLKSFNSYIDHLDQLSPAKLQSDYDIIRKQRARYAPNPNLRDGAQAILVIILGEMIRRESIVRGKHDMSGYECAHRMLRRLQNYRTGSA